MGRSKNQHIITYTNILHSTGYLNHVIDDTVAYQVYIQSEAGDNDTVNNQFEQISPCGDCQGSRSSTNSWRIDNLRHPIIDLTVAATAPSSQCRIRVKNIVPHYFIAMKVGISVITHVNVDVGAHDNNSLRPQQRVHHTQATFQNVLAWRLLWLAYIPQNLIRNPINGIPS